MDYATFQNIHCISQKCLLQDRLGNVSVTWPTFSLAVRRVVRLTRLIEFWPSSKGGINSRTGNLRISCDFCILFDKSEGETNGRWFFVYQQHHTG